MAKNHRSGEGPHRDGPRIKLPVPGPSVRGPADGLSDEQRRERDRDRLRVMQLEGFDGPTWRQVQTDTWGYLVDVLPRMIQSGRLLGIRTRLIGADELSLPDDGITREDAEDLAGDVAPGAMAVFHKQLKAGRWDIRRDITFATWAVNLCALRFPRPYVRWLRDHQRMDSGEVDPELEDKHHDRPESVIYVVEFERYLEAFLSSRHRSRIY